MHTGRAPVPSPLTPLLGREREMAGARAVVEGTRLLTVVGPGGCGKTRLAVEVASAVDDAVFVDLAPVSDAALVLPTVARALGLREAGARPLLATLDVHLRDRDEFVVLDNVEHVLDAVDAVGELLARCARLRVLATSRCPLRLPGESLLPLRPLPVPPDDPGPDDIAAHPSTALFVARLRAAQPEVTFSPADDRLVAAICRALDGLPLALELAAAQVPALGLAEVLVRTAASVRSPGPPRRGSPPRHDSLDTAVAWSVALLDEWSATVFRRLSVFAGTWTAPAAQQVCGEADRDVGPALVTLVEHSLLDVLPAGPTVRYRLLETLRRYSAAMPRRAGDEAVRRRHADWCRTVAAAVGTCAGPDETARIDAGEAALDDLRLVLDRCPPDDTASGLHLAADLYYVWDMRGFLGEGRDRLERLLARAEARDEPAARLMALQSLGLLLLWQDDLDGARTTLHDAATLADQLGDGGAWAWCAGSLGIAHFAAGNVDEVAALVERGLEVAREVGAWMPLLRATCGLGLVRWAQGRSGEARALLEENATLARPTPWGVAKAGYFLGWFAFLDGDLDEADRRFRAGAETFTAIDDHRSLPDCLDGAACVAASRGAGGEALELLATADASRERAGSRRNAYLRAHCASAEVSARAALADDVPPVGVTPRELEVARLIATGLTNRQIGRRLGISERTAERHGENLRSKLGVGTREQIAVWVSAVPTTDGTAVADIPHVARPRLPLH
ncbi:LuxR C-terminal-related transcriptional regulator [Actinomycetospora aeridis]|uniref:LuxR C-terminal-related transcriptional regulator n=1 Tax=Actinomycetospora aeridis TaxID=3129231 RepID=A0ABU8N485_9PSEU